MERQVVFSGVGGQGALTAGLIFAHSAMQDGKKVMYHPQYASQMRGGYSAAFVIVSDKRITAISREAVDAVLDVSGENYNKDCANMIPGGVLVINSDNIKGEFKPREDIKVIKVPMTTITREAGVLGSISFVGYGALLKHTDLYTIDEAVDKMKEIMIAEGKEKTIPNNEKAMRAGYDNA